MDFLYFEEKDDLELIKLVEVNSCLYDKKTREFKTADKKEVWAQIGATLTRKRMGDQAQKRWESLRAMWSRQQKKYYEQGRSGSGTRQDTQEFQYYGEMSFLISHYSSRQTKSNMKQPASCISSDESNGSQYVINKPSTSSFTVMKSDCESVQSNTELFESASFCSDDSLLQPLQPQQEVNEIHKSDINDYTPFSPTAHAVLEKFSSKQSPYYKTCIKEKYKQRDNSDIKVPEVDGFCKKKKGELDNYMRSSAQSLEKVAQSVENILVQKAATNVSNNNNISDNSSSDNDISDMLKCACVGLKQVKPDLRFKCILEVLNIINAYKDQGSQTKD